MRSRILVLGLVLIAILNSCGPRTAKTEFGELEILSPKEIVAEANEKALVPEYLSASVKVKYKSKDAKNSFTAKLRMSKDDTIWVNVSFLGISFARAILTPEGISMYERQNNTYFQGDFRYLSDLLGTELNYYQMQSLLLGMPINEISARQYKTMMSDNSFLLEYKENRDLAKKRENNGDFIKRYWYNPINYELERQMYALPDRSTTLIVENRDFITHEDKYHIPNQIQLQIIDEKLTVLEIEYKGIKVDKKTSFPFRIPSGYKERIYNRK